MSRRHVRPLTPEALAALSTQRLLAYRDKLLSLEASAADSDCSEAELAEADASLVYFKEDPRWRALHDAVLRILADRPHVE